MIGKTCRDNPRAIIAAYRKATGSSLSVVSVTFYGNAGFLPAFLAGKQSMSIKKFDEVIKKFKAKWPANAIWPATRAIIIRGPTQENFPQEN